MSLRKALGLAPLQIAQAVLGFGAIAAFTRLMSAEEFGRYALALSASMFAHTLVFTWAEAAAFRFFAAARAEKRLQDHFATLMAMAVALGAAVLAITAALLLLTGAHSGIAAVSAFAAGSAVFRFLARINRETERADLQVGRYALTETFYLTFGFAAGLAMLTKFDLGPAAPFAGLMLAGLVIFLVDAPRLAERARGGVVSVERARRYAAYGAPLSLAIAVDLGVQALARFILAQQAGEAELGAYAAAWGLARPLDLVFMAAGAALMPLLLTAYEDRGAEAARAVADKLFSTIAAIALPVATGLALVARPLAELLVGHTLSEQAAATLPWLVLAGLFQGFNLYYFSEAFQLSRRTGLRALVMLAPGALQLVLTLYLARSYGAAGAAAATAAAAFAGSVLLVAAGRKLIALPVPARELGKVALACAIMAAEVLVIPPLPGVAGLAGAVLTGVAAYAIAALTLDLFGARARASAVFQSLWRIIARLVQLPFTDRADASAPN